MACLVSETIKKGMQENFFREINFTEKIKVNFTRSATTHLYEPIFFLGGFFFGTICNGSGHADRKLFFSMSGTVVING